MYTYFYCTHLFTLSYNENKYKKNIISYTGILEIIFDWPSLKIREQQGIYIHLLLYPS